MSSSSNTIQSNAEWWASYDGKEFSQKAPVTDVVKNLQDNSEHLFRYIVHKTTSTNGGLVLTFEAIDYSFIAVRFFNVSLRSNRGNNYPASKRGQFIPLEGGKFRKFWMQSVGKKPDRWCKVNKSMKSKLKGIIFVGTIKHAIDSKGNPYIKIIKIRME